MWLLLLMMNSINGDSGYVAHSPLSQSWNSNLKFFVFSSSACCVYKKYFSLQYLISVCGCSAPPDPGLRDALGLGFCLELGR